MLLHSLVNVRPHFFQNRLLLSLEELLGVGQVEEVDLKRSFKVRRIFSLSSPKWGFRVQLANFADVAALSTRLDVGSDGRRGPQVGKVAVVPQDEFGEDDVLDDGVEQEVGQPDEAPEDGAEEEA